MVVKHEKGSACSLPYSTVSSKSETGKFLPIKVYTGYYTYDGGKNCCCFFFLAGSTVNLRLALFLFFIIAAKGKRRFCNVATTLKPITLHTGRGSKTYSLLPIVVCRQ